MVFGIASVVGIDFNNCWPSFTSIRLTGNGQGFPETLIIWASLKNETRSGCGQNATRPSYGEEKK